MRKARCIAVAMAAMACVMCPDAVPAGESPGVKAALSRLRDLAPEIRAVREEQHRVEAESAALAEQLRGVQKKVAAAAAAVDAGSANVAAAENQARQLAQSALALTAAHAARRVETAEILMALQRLARLPPAALLARSETPVDIVKTGTILKTAMEGIERRAQGLRRDLLDLDAARSAIDARHRALERAVAELRVEKSQLDRLVARKSALQAQLATRAWDAAERERWLSRQVGEVETLVSRLRQEEQVREELAATLARHPPPRPPSAHDSNRDFSAELRPETKLHRRPVHGGSHPNASAHVSRRAPGKPAADAAFPPADGRIVARFGEAEEETGASKGVTWRTPPGARVAAPASGVVAFAGPFRGYGLLLIVEHLDGYHSLLAGLERIDVGIGERVRSGDLVGSMGHRDAGNLSLYMELRKNGRPVNPLPWLAAGKRKVSG